MFGKDKNIKVDNKKKKRGKMGDPFNIPSGVVVLGTHEGIVRIITEATRLSVVRFSAL